MPNEHPQPPFDFSGLPGEEITHQGFVDLKAQINSIPALLVAIGFPRLKSLGLAAEMKEFLPSEPDLRLYHLLTADDPHTAYSQYNAWIRRLVSFERAAEHRLWRSQTQPVAISLREEE